MTDDRDEPRDRLAMVNDETFCRMMLPKVSRTFALTIRLLPPPLSYTVTVAYLLCRIADTIEDTAGLEPERRVRLLTVFRGSLGDPSADVEELSRAFARPAQPDQALVRNTAGVLREYWRLPAAQRDAIRPSVEEMCTGMAGFVESLAARSGSIQMLATVEELERYCYYVAGTVGQLLTRLFILEAGRLEPARIARLERLSTRFALGLQVTNIVQDVVADAERGVGFVPHELLGQSSSTDPAARRVALQTLVSLAMSCLWDAIEYCACLPRRLYRVRLFCLAAPNFAVRTLHAVQQQLAANPAYPRPKITRGAVYRTLAMTFLVAPSNAMLRGYFGRLARRVRLSPPPASTARRPGLAEVAQKSE